VAIHPKRPLISFTFDDFPRSALLTGGSILRQFGLAGTYYVSLGLAGKQTATGEMFLPEDLRAVLEHGHELGCHTFSHCHSWQTDSQSFEKSVIENQTALNILFPGAGFKTFSYPISPPRPLTKARIANRFMGCREGGQTFNTGSADLNQLSAYFLEKSRDNLPAVKEVIDFGRKAHGWLIFATHDVCENPTPYGCVPEFFKAVVKYAVDSGAEIVPVVKALEILKV
jgi:peptidoglycan/xylan/chitin deacetylase (PgdA/CDA1 family)